MLPAMEGTGLNRRTFLKLGLASGAALSVWELYKGAFDTGARGNALSKFAFDQIGLDGARLSRLLEIALERGGDYADVFLEHSFGTRMDFDGELISNCGVDVTCGGAVRVIVNGQTFFKAVVDLSWEGLSAAARGVSLVSRTGGPAKLPLLKPLRESNLYPVESAVFGEPIAGKKAIVYRMIEAAQSSDPRVDNVQSTYSDTTRLIAVAASTGVIAHDVQPLIQLGVSIRVTDEKTGRKGMGSFIGGGHYGLEYFSGQRPEDFGRKSARLALHHLEGKEPPAGEMPVVLGPAYSGVLLHEAVGHGLEADYNVNSYSTYSTRAGQIVASPLCTVVDDGRRPWLNGSINFDDEGTLSASNVLIDRGRLAGYMHSRETARAMGVAPTGNGRRQGFSNPPIPRMTNTYLMGGDTPPEDIIRSVDRGVYASSFQSGNANITSGDFSFVPTEVFLIEHGRITAPISDLLLIGNGPQILTRISMVGNDMAISDNLWRCGKEGQFVPVTVGTPTIKVDKMLVGGNLQ